MASGAATAAPSEGGTPHGGSVRWSKWTSCVTPVTLARPESTSLPSQKSRLITAHPNMAVAIPIKT